MGVIRKFMLHRIFLIIVALILQLLVLIGVILSLNDYFTFFYVASILISVGVVLWIINSNSNPAYKIVWIVPILIFPIFGGLFYIFFGGNYLSKRTKKRMKYIEDKTKEILLSSSEIIGEIATQNLDAANQARYIQDYSFCPPYKNTRALYLPTGEIKFAKLKEELRNAKDFIFLEYFIIEEGLMWSEILEILKEKADQGLDVRVIYDDIGCLVKLPYKYDERLEKMGIKCSVFNPLTPVLSPRLNNRDHRKIAIIDGHTGFTGGINPADEYINEIVRFGHWKDTAIMIKGEAVQSLTAMFLSMWDYIRGIDEDFSLYAGEPPIYDGSLTDGYVQPFADSPLDDEPVGQLVYLNLINKAKKYVYITTPYLIIDNEMVTALSSAAKSGVDVRIITPHHPDKWYVHSVTKSYYTHLVAAGVRIYEYSPGFIHSKTMVADDEYGIVGTINMDYRSLYLHFECGVWMYGNSSIVDIKADFFATLELCQEITMKDVMQIKWYQTFTRSILRVFAPLL